MKFSAILLALTFLLQTSIAEEINYTDYFMPDNEQKEPPSNPYKSENENMTSIEGSHVDYDFDIEDEVEVKPRPPKPKKIQRKAVLVKSKPKNEVEDRPEEAKPRIKDKSDKSDMFKLQKAMKAATTEKKSKKVAEVQEAKREPSNVKEKSDETDMLNLHKAMKEAVSKPKMKKKRNLKANNAKKEINQKPSDKKLISKEKKDIEVAEVNSAPVIKNSEVDSLWCDTHVALLTKKHKNYASIVEKNMAPLVRDLKSFLQSLSKEERQSAEGGLFANDKAFNGLTNKAERFGKRIGKNKKFEFTQDIKDQSDDPLATWPYLAILSQKIEDQEWKIQVKLTNQKDEEEQINKQLEELKKAPPLQVYLEQELPQCFAKIDPSRVNRSARTIGKEVPDRKPAQKAKDPARAVEY